MKKKGILHFLLIGLGAIIMVALLIVMVNNSRQVDFTGTWVLFPFSDTDYGQYPGELDLYKNGTGSCVVWRDWGVPKDTYYISSWTHDGSTIMIQVTDGWNTDTIQYYYKPRYRKFLFLKIYDKKSLILTIKDGSGYNTSRGEIYDKK